MSSGPSAMRSAYDWTPTDSSTTSEKSATSRRIAGRPDSFRRVQPANVLQTFWPVAANALQTSDRRNLAEPGETTHAIPRAFGVSCPCSLSFAEHEPIGENG